MTTKAMIASTSGAPTTSRSAPGRYAGFANLFAKEMGAWWRTKTWWVQLLLFLGAVVGLPAAATFQMKAAGELAGGPLEVYLVFLMLHQIFAAGSAIITAQGAIVGEKEAGTAAWILSKPVSRASFVLAKAAALATNFLLVAGVVPLVAIFAVWSVAGIAPGAQAMAYLALGMSLTVLFYLSLTLALGTLFSGRAAVAGAAFFLFFVFTQLGQSLPDLVPGGMPFRVVEVLNGQPLASSTSFLITAAAAMLLLIGAVARFRSTEL